MERKIIFAGIIAVLALSMATNAHVRHIDSEMSSTQHQVNSQEKETKLIRTELNEMQDSTGRFIESIDEFRSETNKEAREILEMIKN